MHVNAKKRMEILRVLYQARAEQSANKNKDGWLAEFDLKQATGLDTEFGLSVLVDLGQIKRDGQRYRITGAGVVVFEEFDQA